MRAKCLENPKLRNNNEFYTLYESVQWLFENTENIKSVFNNKIVYLPCDSEKSNILKYLQNNKEELQIKEILYTSDDYYGHLDLYDKADIVITNPPFTGLNKWILFLYSINKKFIIWGPYNWNQYKNISKYIIDGNLKCIQQNKILNNFEEPDGTKRQVTEIHIISNIDEIPAYSRKLEIDPKHTIEYLIENNLVGFYNDIPITKNSKYIPYNYYNPIYISFTCLLDYYNNFEICKDDDCFQNMDKRRKQFSHRTFPGKYFYKVVLRIDRTKEELEKWSKKSQVFVYG